MGTVLEMTMSAIHFQGKLATSHHLLRYIADVAMPIFTVVLVGNLIRVALDRESGDAVG